MPGLTDEHTSMREQKLDIGAASSDLGTSLFVKIVGVLLCCRAVVVGERQGTQVVVVGGGLH